MHPKRTAYEAAQKLRESVEHYISFVGKTVPANSDTIYGLKQGKYYFVHSVFMVSPFGSFIDDVFFNVKNEGGEIVPTPPYFFDLEKAEEASHGKGSYTKE